MAKKFKFLLIAYVVINILATRIFPDETIGNVWYLSISLVISTVLIIYILRNKSTRKSLALKPAYLLLYLIPFSVAIIAPEKFRNPWVAGGCILLTVLIALIIPKKEAKSDNTESQTSER